MNILDMTYMASMLIIAIVLLRALLINKLPKQGFILLWGVALARLLVPFSIPFDFSFFSIVNKVVPATQPQAFSQIGFSQIAISTPQVSAVASMPIEQTSNIPTQNITDFFAAIPIERMVWIVGAVALALFFIINHLRWRKKYLASLPVENSFVFTWQIANPLRRKVSVRQLDCIVAPITYGIFKPVILMPKNTDYDDIVKLEYILSHEYAHIRRFDTLLKALLCSALCLHWFNPLVWLMYVLANRDIELCCDDKVVRKYGIDTKSSYALTLIGMEEAKSTDPLCNCFNKNAVKERITSIMKIKKMPIIAIIVAIILVTGVTVAFATSATATPSTDIITENTALSNGAYTILTEQDREDINKLKPENYLDMSVQEYHDGANTLANKAFTENLLDKLTITNYNPADPDMAYISNIFLNLTAEDYKERRYSGAYSVSSSLASSSDTGEKIINPRDEILQYKLKLNIADESLTVRAYDSARNGAITDLIDYFQKQVEAGVDIKSASFQEKLNTEAQRIKEKYDSSKLIIDVEAWTERSFSPPSTVVADAMEAQEQTAIEQAAVEQPVVENIATEVEIEKGAFNAEPAVTENVFQTAVTENVFQATESATEVSGRITEQDLEQLNQLRPENYRDMSITEFRAEVGKLAAESENDALLETIAKGYAFATEVSDEKTSSANNFNYISRVFVPLLQDDYKTHEYVSATSLGTNYHVESLVRLNIMDDSLKVGEFEEAQNLTDELIAYYNAQPKDTDFASSSFKSKLDSEIKRLVAKYRSDKLQVVASANTNYGNYYTTDEKMSSSIVADFSNIEVTEDLLQKYLPAKLTYDEDALKRGIVRMFYDGKDVMSLFDTKTGTFISNGMNPNLYNQDYVKLETVYAGDVLRNLKVVNN